MLKVSISLSKAGQTEEARRLIVKHLNQHGVHQTGGGLVTLTFAAESIDFDRLFKSTTVEFSDPIPRARETVGASSIYLEPPIVIPDFLSSLINHVSILPAARHFGSNEEPL